VLNFLTLWFVLGTSNGHEWKVLVPRVGLWVVVGNLREKKTYSASELYRPSYRRLSAKLVPTLADRGCRLVSAANLHGR
jgi:hypothetical protein